MHVFLLKLSPRDSIKHHCLRELGSYVLPFLRSSARVPAIKAARGTVAIRGVFENESSLRCLLQGGGGPFPLRGIRSPYGPLLIV